MPARRRPTALQLDLVSLTVTNTGTVEATGTQARSICRTPRSPGGTVGGAGTIATQISGSDSTLNNVTIASGTAVKVTDNTALDLTGTIANGGTIALNSSGDTTQLEISGNVSLNGTAAM